MTHAQGTVLSLGSINLDVQVRAPHWPTESETVLAGDFLCAGGGKAANVALLAARLGTPSQLFGRIGDDSFAELALTNLKAARVDLRHVRRASGQATALAMIVVRPDGDKTIVLSPNANACWEEGAEHDLVRSIGKADESSVLVADLEVPLPIVRKALKAAREKHLVTILDPSPADRMEDDLFELCDYVTPNPREAQRLTDIAVKREEDAIRAGRKLVERGAKHGCVKLQGGGAILASPEGVHVLRAPRVKVVDQTGAGDAFAGGLAVGLCAGLPALEAMRHAILTSTFAVTRYGSQAAYPSRAEFERFCEKVRA
jgi:ribokinase